MGIASRADADWKTRKEEKNARKQQEYESWGIKQIGKRLEEERKRKEEVKGKEREPECEWKVRKGVERQISR